MSIWSFFAKIVVRIYEKLVVNETGDNSTIFAKNLSRNQDAPFPLFHGKQFFTFNPEDPE
jgi:hypothetical protein